MSDLQFFQETMTSAILSGEFSGFAGQFHAGAADPQRRLDIFRNNTFISLTECLKTVFPVTVLLSDERFFAYAAHEFIAMQPPREARLSRYGAAFPRFLANFEPCREFPVIAEMAALEWAISECLNSPEELPVPISMLTELGAAGAHLGLCLQPNLKFNVSRWPLLGVWADHRKEHVVISGPLKPRVSRVAISRHDDDIQCLELDVARFAFWRALARGRSIEEAARRALLRDRLFDLVRETMLLFRSGLVTGIFTSI
jgi:hypothetical protein